MFAINCITFLYIMILKLCSLHNVSNPDSFISNLNENILLLIKNNTLYTLDKKNIPLNQDYRLSNDRLTQLDIITMDSAKNKPRFVTNQYRFLAVGNAVKINDKYYIPAVIKRWFFRDRIVLLEQCARGLEYIVHDLGPGHNTPVTNIQLFEHPVAFDNQSKQNGYYIISSSTFPTVKCTRALLVNHTGSVVVDSTHFLQQKELKNRFLIGSVGSTVLCGQINRYDDSMEITSFLLEKDSDLDPENFKRMTDREKLKEKLFYFQEEVIEKGAYIKLFLRFAPGVFFNKELQKSFLLNVKMSFPKQLSYHDPYVGIVAQTGNSHNGEYYNMFNNIVDWYATLIDGTYKNANEKFNFFWDYGVITESRNVFRSTVENLIKVIQKRYQSLLHTFVYTEKQQKNILDTCVDVHDNSAAIYMLHWNGQDALDRYIIKENIKPIKYDEFNWNVENQFLEPIKEEIGKLLFDGKREAVPFNDALDLLNIKTSTIETTTVFPSFITNNDDIEY